jgi:hypothetical protein
VLALCVNTFSSFQFEMLSCHCLNVIVETEGDLQKVTAGTLGLSREELQDSFFEQVRRLRETIGYVDSSSPTQFIFIGCSTSREIS